ncbi:hypothetical protein [Actinomadura rupiterrae]|uniref:hypothetical protein n=1 Tax=Actinomadura rupiterrae TaxID=559627 RepID=UPI0020A2AC33|nr:hypothetical protein [Actinomadura rupiterrae]MCP2342275.1 hypothetical protein [Actinomadura rupiterrae]
MSFDLAVLALAPGETLESAQAMLERCRGGGHPEGEIDQRIAVFGDELRAAFPDHGKLSEESPWMSVPLNVGIDHVILHMSHSAKSDPALRLVGNLAGRLGLAIYDPQSSELHFPDPPQDSGDARGL